MKNHLKKEGVHLSVLTMPWFLCLFIGYLPLQETLRILDIFFFEGPTIFFKIAMTIIKLNCAKLLERASDEIVMSLKDDPLDLLGIS